MADLSKILRRTCPNVCKKCRPQCKKWQEISNLEGPKLMKFIKTQQEIAKDEAKSLQHKTNFKDTDIASTSDASHMHAKITCCVTCDTILQQISILLYEIWDILEPKRMSCEPCRLARSGECNCQQISTHSLQGYSQGVSITPSKGRYISWLTKLRHILLAVLEGVTRSRCLTYKGEPKDELEKLLEELRVPLQKQARDVRITSLTRTPLSSTEHDVSLIACLIENTELLERVLAKIKDESDKIEMKIPKENDQAFQGKSKSGRFPELQRSYNEIATHSVSSNVSTKAVSDTSDNISFPPIASKMKSDRKELKSGATSTKDNKSEQFKSDALLGLDNKDKASHYDNFSKKFSRDTSKERSQNIAARKKDTIPPIYGKLPSKDTKEEERQKRSWSHAEKSSVHEQPSKNSKDTNKKWQKHSRSQIRDQISSSREKLPSKHAKEIGENYDIKKSHSELQFPPRFPLPDKEHRSRLSTRSAVSQDKRVSYGAEKSKDLKSLSETSKRKSPKHSESPLGVLRERKTKGIKQHTEMEGTSKRPEVTQDELQKARARAAKDHSDTNYKGRWPKEPELSRGDIFKSKQSIKYGAKSLTSQLTKEEKIFNRDVTRQRSKYEGGKDETDIKKIKKFKKASKEFTVDSDLYTRRKTVIVPSKHILKKMNEQKVAQLSLRRRAERMNRVKKLKIKSIKSLPNLEMLKETEKQRRELRRKKLEAEAYLDTEIVECAPTPEPLEMIRGDVVVPVESFVTAVDGDAKPLLFKLQADLDDNTHTSMKLRSPATTLRFQKSPMGKGVIVYSLSNPKFIELGYTKLPSVSVMRKSFIYKMVQPHPEHDWFRRHKEDKMLFYDTCERLAEIDDDGHGRWYYKNGRLALNYSAAEEKDARNRYIVFSSGENDANGNARCDTILAIFDHLGNGIVFDHCGNVRLKYNQNEGENFDKSIGPTGRWKWHALDTSLSALQNVYFEKHVKLISQSQLDLTEEENNHGNKAKAKEPFEEEFQEIEAEQKRVLSIEMGNLLREKKQLILQKYQPFQLKMKALKLNEQFSLRIYEQRKVLLYFSAGNRNLKLNLGLTLISNEILGTETVNLREILTPFDRLIPQSESIANILDIVGETRKKMRKRSSINKKLYT